MSDARIQALQQTAMFGAINDATVGFLLERASVVEVGAGGFFFREGERGDSAFLIEAGRVSIIKVWGQGAHLLRRLGPGDCFGEVALLDFGSRSASVQADVDTTALQIRSADLQAVAQRDIEQFALIYMNLGRELSRRLRSADERLFRTNIAEGRPIDAETFEAWSL